MPRLISFFLTTPQFIDGSKDVTRRLGWWSAKKGDVLEAVEKAQGLGKGGKVKRLGKIELIDVRQETLSRMIHQVKYGIDEARREGFPEWNGMQFVEFFCETNKCAEHDVVMRLEFKRI